MELSNPSDQNVSESAFETDCAHFAEDPIAQGGGAAPPIHQSSTFVYPNAEAFERRRSGETPYPDYTRAGNPTTAILEAKLARLEKGSWARCFASQGYLFSCCWFSSRECGSGARRRLGWMSPNSSRGARNRHRRPGVLTPIFAAGHDIPFISMWV